MTTNHLKRAVIYRNDWTFELLRAGFKCYEVETSSKKEGKIVFIFEKTKELEEFIKENFGICL